MTLEEAVGHKVRVELEDRQVYEGVIGQHLFSIGDAENIDPTCFRSDEAKTGGNMILVKCDDIIVKLEHKFALQVNLLRNMMETDKGDNSIYCLPGITKKTLLLGIRCSLACMKGDTLFDLIDRNILPEYKLQPVEIRLFNIIQAAHYFKIKSLMDLACVELRNVVETRCRQLAIEVKSTGLYVCPPEKHSARARHPEVTVSVICQRGPGEVTSILRSHGRETFIARLDSKDVHCSSFAANMLSFNKKSKVDACLGVLKMIHDLNAKGSMAESDLYKLYYSVKRLKCLVNGDPRLPEDISAADVAKSLVQILDNVGNTAIQRCCIFILSRGHFDKCSNVIKGEALPLIVRLINSEKCQLVKEVLNALSRLVYAYPDTLQVILGALEAAQNIFSKNHGNHEVLNDFATFMAAVCRGVNLSSVKLTDDKVKTILTILKELFKLELHTSCHIVHTCYALSYLSYERCVPIEAAELKRLTKLFIDVDISIAGAALGVVANIARWGTDNQIRLLAEDPKLVQGLELNWLGCAFKIFQKGACQIISNMAARSDTCKEKMLRLMHPLLNLLFEENREYKENEDESDVQMEAAWSVLNCCYRYDEKMIDKYA